MRISCENITESNSGASIVYNLGKYKLLLEDRSGFVDPSFAELPIATGLLLAMFNRDDIDIDGALSVSESFFDCLVDVQNVVHQWNHKLKPVRVNARTAKREKDPEAVGISYSGGVDSLYTFLKNKEKTTHLLFLRKFEPGGSAEESAIAEDRIRVFAGEFEKTLVPIDYNARQFSADASISWRFLHGPVLAGLALSSVCSEFLISSSFNYRMLKPWGSHPLLDPLWSTKETKIQHVGLEATRVQKTAAIAAVPEVYKYLQVCWASNASNCGNCSKCVRTGVTLHLLGAPEGPVPMKGVEQKVAKWNIDEDGAAEHVYHLMHLARDVGNRGLENVFSGKLASFLRKQALHNAGRELLGDRLTRLLRPKRDWHAGKVLLTDPGKFRD